jgi:5-dehydro-4-deoxyglucarate dehydratase
MESGAIRTPSELPAALVGLLGFPITPFRSDGLLNIDAFRRQVDLLLSYGARAIFPACGTGELQSLSVEEYREIVRACVDEVQGRVPVVAGVGFGYGIAIQMATIAEDSGADGVLVFPPYLGSGAAQGQVAYYRDLAAHVDIALILYQRDQALFAPATVAELARVENIVALKDGTGHVELIQKQRGAVSDPRFAFLNGVPTAELVAPAMAKCGVQAYSSALLNVMPEFAVDFFEAASAGDVDRVEELTRDVLVPFVSLRDRAPGYAVSLVKAGVRLRGGDVGHVRAPLTEPTQDDVDAFGELLHRLDLAHPLADGWGRRDPVAV